MPLSFCTCLKFSIVSNLKKSSELTVPILWRDIANPSSGQEDWRAVGLGLLILRTSVLFFPGKRLVQGLLGTVSLPEPGEWRGISGSSWLTYLSL